MDAEVLKSILWHLRESERSIYVKIDVISIYEKMKLGKKKWISAMDDIYNTADESA